MTSTYVDVLIVGAGLSGIGAACHLKQHCPNKSFAIFERRAQLGGTWDLFRYPGIRSDSDMYTFGYNFKPWLGEKTLTDGESIKTYINEAASEYQIHDHIHYHHSVESAKWSSVDAKWTLEVRVGNNKKRVQYSCRFLLMCSGYYDYEQGYLPTFKGIDEFKGQLIHPQHWPEQLDYEGKQVIVIGSGATAFTLVPAMTDKAAHVTMLQRSPTYVISVPSRDRFSEGLRKYMSEKAAYRIMRTRNIAIQALFYAFARARPEVARKFLLGEVRKRTGKQVDMKHFTPSYKPWDQRICAVPDSDIFKAIKKGKASVVTDNIDIFTAEGIQLTSGKKLTADIIVTATGLNLQLFGGMQVFVDGKEFIPSEAMNYKGVMFENVPNLGLTFGYTNASWTLKADLTSEYVCRLLKTMDKKGMRQCTPRNHNSAIKPTEFLDFSSGYVQRAVAFLPKSGSKAPWRLKQIYVDDIVTLRHKPVDDGVLEFSSPV